MSAQRLSNEKNINNFPIEVIKAFRNAEEPKNPIETLWREFFARVTLDALGYTGLTGEPDEHDTAVREARRWFRGFPDDSCSYTVADNAGMATYLPKLTEAVLNQKVEYMLDNEDEFYDVELYDDDHPLNLGEIDPEFLGTDNP